MLFTFMGIAQEWHGITKNSAAAPVATLVSSSENEVVVNFELGGFYTTNVKTPNGKQAIVSVDRMASMLEAGAPDLPMFPIPAIIGDRAEMNVNIVKSEYVDFENMEIAPSKGNFSREINPDDVAFTYGEMYNQNAFYPAEQAYLEAPYILRDFRGQNIMVKPFAYNPVTKTLRVYTKMTIAMTKVSDNGENQKLTRKSNTIKVDKEFLDAYADRFINFESAEKTYTFVVDQGLMLVVCYDTYLDALQPLVDWKNISGRPTEIVASSVTGTDTNLKNYIQAYYAEHPELTFILLVGEHSQLPGHSLSGGRSDNWYGQLDGSDYYLEVLTGRFSPASVADCENQVNRTIYYERDVPAGAAWCNHGMGIGHTDGPGHYGETDWQHIDKVRDTLMHYTYTQVTQRYVNYNTVTNEIISQDINAGISIANYCNHGSATSWAATNYNVGHVNALTNDYMLPYVISVACNNGQFDVGECFGESWMRSVNESTGAPCGGIGGMFSWISQPWQPPMYGQDEMNRILTEWIGDCKHTMAGVSLNGSMFILDAQPGDGGQTHNTWILFGDPSVMLRTDVPTDMNVSLAPAALMLGMSELEITADAAFAIATLSMDGEVIGTCNIVNGQGTMSFPALSNVGTAQLVIVGYNRVTYNETIEILPAEGPYMTVSGYTPTNVPAASEQTMSMSFKNVGVDPTAGTTTVTLNCENDAITLTDNEGAFDVVAADETITLTDEFAYTVAAGVEDGTKVQINVTMTCGSATWTGKAMITIGAPIVEFDSFQYAGSFVPGTTSIVVANFKNTGHYMATNAVVTISSPNGYVTFENETFEIGTIEAEGMGTSVFNVNIDENCPSTEQIPLVFTLVADNEVSAEGSGVLKNSCNVVFTLHDSYGDGWNGNAKLTVTFDDGTPAHDIKLQSGSDGEEVLEIGSGVHVTLTWTAGSWDGEISFEVAYEGGEQILAIQSPTAGIVGQFDVNCGGGGTTLDPVQNLTAEADFRMVTLTWEAPATGEPEMYIIKRNNVQIAETEELTYVDEDLAIGVYTYMIIAKYAEGESMPVAVTAEVTEDAVEENEANFGIYPNPAENVLNIVSNAQFEYQVINSIGQVVMNGKANGNAQLNVNELNGVYFVKVIADGNTTVRKVVVK